MHFDESVFKAYDIRGIAGKQVTAELAHAVGRAFADWLPKAGPVAVGRDMRLDSKEIADALIEGLREQGRDVWDIGLVTSDMINFAVAHHGLAGGGMVTASHNPGQDDGIKLCREEAKPVGRETGLLDIKLALKRDHYKPSSHKGEISPTPINDEWIKHALAMVDPQKVKPFRIAVDAGNGMAGSIMPSVEEKLPIKVARLYYELDGNFPNHPANPADLANLQDLIKKVVAEKLDFGIAFDGDGDRALLVDETGSPVSGSAMLGILAQHTLQSHAGSSVVYSTLCSRVVPEMIERLGGRAIRTKVGNESIKWAMRENDAELGGEPSGHYYFKRNFYCDSGLIAALVAIEAISVSGKKLSELAAPFRKYFATEQINSRVEDIGRVVELLMKRYNDGEADVLDGLSIFYKDWWFNIRASNTEPLIRLNVEADNPKLLRDKTYELLNILRS
jgi:phosphomannomutase